MEEFQAVVMAGGVASGLYPLADDETQKSLLPLGGKVLLGYPLWALERAGLNAAIVVCRKRDVEAFENYVYKEFAGTLRIELFPVSDDCPGTLDALRQLGSKLTKDCLVLPGDLVTTADLLEFANVHRVKGSALSILFCPFDLEQFGEKKDPSKPDKGRKILNKLNKNLVQYVGVDGDDRVALLHSAAAEDPFSVPKHLLVRDPVLRLRTDLQDGHVYLLCRWLVDLIVDPTSVCSNSVVTDAIQEMNSLRCDFIPFVVNKLQSRRGEELAALQLSLPGEEASVNCGAYICPANSMFCRANSMFSYKALNHLVVGTKARVPWPEVELLAKSKTTTVGHSTQIGEKVQLNNCVIGSHCTIGSGCKLSNTVIMDHCQIGTKVVAQNSILGSHVSVSNDCRIEQAQIQKGSVVVPAGASLKDQAYLKTDFA